MELPRLWAKRTKRKSKMIDVIYNKETKTLTIAHDDWRLDGYKELSIDNNGGLFLTKEESRHHIGTLNKSIAKLLSDDTGYQMIRVSGWTIVRTTRLKRRT
jgi:hypothetical protein